MFARLAKRFLRSRFFSPRDLECGGVMLLHRVVDGPDNVPSFGPCTSVDLDDFAGLVSRMRLDFDVVSLDDFVATVQNRQDCRGKLAITFDDGFRDNQTLASTVLADHNVPWTLFASTGFIAGNCQPYEYMLAGVIDQVDSLRITINDEELKWNTADSQSKQLAYQEIRLSLKPESHPIRENAMASIHPSIQIDDSVIPAFLSIQALQELDRDPLVTIGGHTVNHLLLSRCGTDDVEFEISRDKATLEDWLGHSIRHFAYPYGGFDDAAKRCAAASGYHAAFTTQASEPPGPIDPFEIPRFEVTRQNIRSLLNASVLDPNQ